MEPLAKPTGITLADHTRHVRDEAVALLKTHAFSVRKYATLTGRNLEELVLKAAEWHDAGKQDEWQKYCRLDHADWLRLGQPHNFRGKYLQKSGIRHELDSLRRLHDPRSPDCKLPMSVYSAIAAHHSKLGYKHKRRWEGHDKHKWFWEQFEKKASQPGSPDDPASFDLAIRQRYEYDGPRALLQLADHRASAKEASVVVPEIRKFSYHFPHAGKRGVQQLITELWDEPFAILRAPTGAGKTDASLLWAQRQIVHNRADRLVIAMPTRFTANSLAIATAEALGSTGLYHSSAWYAAKNAPTAPETAGWKAELDYARQLETPVTATTIDHLCLCLTGAREDHHAIFWNLAHSCVVIDEADFYDDFTQLNLVVLLRALRLLRVPVLLMSATVPESARQLYALAGQHTSRIWEDEQAEELTRPRCQLRRASPCAAPDILTGLPADIDALLRRGLAGEPLIIYANTVRRAQAYYDWLRRADPDFEDVVLYHSRFIEPDKAEIEERLKSLLGKEAWKAGTQRGIAILTQIGELSVNISADLMLSDMCPIDRLAQRVGRLARFNERGPRNEWVTGELYLVEPMTSNKEGKLLSYPAPYGHYKQGSGWEPSAILTQSGEWLTEGVYSAQDFMKLVNKLYPMLVSPTAEARRNMERLEEMVVRDWLIVPRHEISPEDDDTPEWKSRDIDAQKTVLVEVDTSGIDGGELGFASFLAFREWSLPKSITIPTYEYNRALKQGMLELTDVHIGHDQSKEVIAAVKRRYYFPERGLAFEEKTDFDELEAS